MSITDSVFRQHTSWALYSQWVQISGCEIYNNGSNQFYNSGGDQAVYASGGVYHPAVITNSTVRDNLGTGIAVYNSGRRRSFSVKWTYITNNTIGISHSGGESGSITESNVCGNSQYNLQLTASSNAMASNVWWGTANHDLARSGIYDACTDATKGMAHVGPVLGAPSAGVQVDSACQPPPSSDAIGAHCLTGCIAPFPSPAC